MMKNMIRVALVSIYTICLGMVAGCDTSRSNTGSDESSTGTDGASTPTFTASNITVSCSYFADDSGDYGRTVVKGSLAQC